MMSGIVIGNLAATGGSEWPFNEVAALGMLFFFAPIELGDWAMVAHDAGPDFAGLTFAFVELGVGGVHGI